MSSDFIIIITALLVAGPCALLGTVLVLRQMAMMGDAISHAVLPGIVIAFFITESLGPLVALVGATVFGLLTAALVEALKNTGRVKEDSSIGVVFTALFALGVFLISRFAGDVHLDLKHVLYGAIEFSPLNYLVVGGVSLGPRSFWTLGIVAAIVVAFVFFFYKELKVSTFDAGLAAAMGFSPILVHYLLMAVVSVTVVGAFDSVGAILVVALLIAPPAAAYLITDRLSHMMGFSVAIGAASAVVGYYSSALLDVSVSGMMATAAGALFVLALLFSPARGLVAVALRNRRNRRSFSRGLLLSRLGSLGGHTTEDELARYLDWDRSAVSRAFEEALDEGLVLRPADDEVALTGKGREAAHQLARVSI
ncbi:MAG: iron chelate uptake ABC transporter family permease subunit [Rubrobacteraceae bacterium]